jgi:GTPase
VGPQAGQHPQPAGVRRGQEAVKAGESAEHRVDRATAGDVVAVAVDQVCTRRVCVLAPRSACTTLRDEPSNDRHRRPGCAPLSGSV